MVRRTGRYTKKARAARRQATLRVVVLIVILIIAAGGYWWWRTRPKIDIWPIPSEQGQDIYITLFFPDSTDTFLIPVQRKVNIGRQENKYLRALKELRRGPVEDQEHLLPALPAQCNILGVDVSGKTAKADFNMLTLDLLDETSEKWFYKSVVHTLAAFDEVQRVEFTFEGKRITALPQGTDVSQPRPPGDLNLSFAPVPEGETEKLLVYFPDINGKYLVPLTERIPKPASKNDLIGQAVQQILAGPQSVDKDYLLPLFNKGVKLQEQGGVVEEGGKLTLAFDVADPATALKVDFDKVVMALRLTFEKLLPFNEFAITINGKPASELLGLPGKVNDIGANGRFNVLSETPVESALPQNAGDENG